MPFSVTIRNRKIFNFMNTHSIQLMIFWMMINGNGTKDGIQEHQIIQINVSNGFNRKKLKKYSQLNTEIHPLVGKPKTIMVKELPSYWDPPFVVTRILFLFFFLQQNKSFFFSIPEKLSGFATYRASKRTTRDKISKIFSSVFYFIFGKIANKKANKHTSEGFMVKMFFSCFAISYLKNAFVASTLCTTVTFYFPSIHKTIPYKTREC